MPAKPHRKIPLINPLPFESKLYKNIRGCPNECSSSGENPQLVRHWLPWSTKEFSQQKKYTVRQAVELLFDDEFGLSDGDISEEEGKEVYSYRGGESLSKEAVEDLGREVDTVTGGDSFSASSQEESEK